MKLSVLDQAPVSTGDSAENTLHHSIQLAKFTENLGFHRYWVAEHHNTNGLASTSPEILISKIASETNRMRIGSGGVLLPQYSPLKVAETFKMLEVLYPGRIDLGLGRSPGGTEITRLALTDGHRKPLSAFPRQVKDLLGYLYDDMPPEHSYYGVKATPFSSNNPETWILGLSERGARHAALNGTGFTFGHFISPDKAQDAITTYKEKFRPSKAFESPHINACVFVVCAETQEEAEELALSQDLWLLNVAKGKDTRIPSIEEVKQKRFSIQELKKIEHNRRRAIVGTPDTVKEQLEDLSRKYSTDEFLIITNIHSFEKKKKSYELIAEAVFN